MLNTKLKAKSKPAALDGTDLYAAEAILDSKVDKDGTTKYLIKWLGWGMKYNSWEPVENIASESLIQEFLQKRCEELSHKKAHKKSNHSGNSSRKHHKRHDKSKPKTHRSGKNFSAALGSCVEERHPIVDQITNVKQTNDYSVPKEANDLTDKDPILLSITSHLNTSAIKGQSIVETPDPTNKEQTESDQTFGDKNSENSSGFESISSLVNMKTSATKTGANSSHSVSVTEVGDNYRPQVVLERLPKLLLKRYQNSYEIQIKTSDYQNSTQTESSSVEQNENVVQNEVQSPEVQSVIGSEISDNGVQNNEKSEESHKQTEEAVPFTGEESVIESENNVQKISNLSDDEEVVPNEGSAVDSEVTSVQNNDQNKESENTSKESDIFITAYDFDSETEDKESKENDMNSETWSTSVEVAIAIIDRVVESEERTVEDMVNENNSNQLEEEEEEEVVPITGEESTVETQEKEIEINDQNIEIENFNESNEGVLPINEEVEASAVQTDVQTSDHTIENSCQEHKQTDPSVDTDMDLNANTSDDQNISTAEEEVISEPIHSPELIIPGCYEDFEECGAEICDHIIVANDATDLREQTSDPHVMESDDTAVENTEESYESGGEEMVEITVQLSEENIEFLKNSDNEDIVVQMSEQIEDILIEPPEEQTSEEIDYNKTSAEVSGEVTVEEQVEEQTNEIVDASEDIQINGSETKSPIIDVVDSPDMKVTKTCEPVPNNDDSIDANLMVRQPSNETYRSEDSGKESIDSEVSRLTPPTKCPDALQKKPNGERLDFKNIITINNQNKCNNELLDLTFNDDIMLDTVENNYISTGHRATNKTITQISDSLYSPISEDDRDWSSVESNSSPESNDEFRRHESGKSAEKAKQPVLHTVTAMCEKPIKPQVESGATTTGPEQYNVAQLQSSPSSESTPTTAKWKPQSDLIDNRVQTISYHSSIESGSRSHQMAGPPSVTLAQSQPSVNCITPPLTSQTPTAQNCRPIEALSIDGVQTRPKSQMGNSSEQATSALLSGILLDNSSQDSANSVPTRLPPTHHIQKKEDQLRGHSLPKPMLSPTVASPQPTPVITTLNSSPSVRSSVVPPSLPLTTRESPVADASSWPLLSQTNLALNQTYRPTSVIELLTTPRISYNNQFMSRSAPGMSVPPSHPHMMDNRMRSHLTELHPIPEPRKRGRPPSIAQVRTHPYLPPMNSYNQMLYSSGQLRQQLNAPHFPSPVTKAMPPMSQMPIRTDINTTNVSTITTQDMRIGSGFTSNVNSMRGHPHYVTQSGYPYVQFDHMSREAMIRQISAPTYMTNQSQQSTGPYIRPSYMSNSSVHSPDYSSNIQHRPQERLHSAPANRQYAYQSIASHLERPPFTIPSAHTQQQTLPSLRPSFISSPVDSSQRKITVEPKQSTDMRDKLQPLSNQPMRSMIGGGGGHPTPQEFNAMMGGYHQKVGNNDNIANKERVVERVLDSRYRLDGIPYHMTQSHERQILSQRNQNLMNVQMNRCLIPNITEQNPQILRSVLSQSTEPNTSPFNQTRNTSFNTPNNYDPSRERQLNINIEANQNNFDSIFITDSLSPTNTTSTRTSKSCDKDILSEAMEEIVESTEVTDDDHLIHERGPVVHIQTPEATDDESRGQSSSEENGQCICIPYDESHKTPEELMEYLKSQGFQVVESDSQESQSSNKQEDRVTVPETEDDLVIQIDEKMLAEASDGSGEVLLVFNDQNNDKTEDKSNTEVTNDSNLVSDPTNDEITDKAIDCNNNSETIVEEPVVTNSVTHEELVIPYVDSVDENKVQNTNQTETETVAESEPMPRPMPRPMPIPYISMPTFCFDDKQRDKSQISESEDESGSESEDNSESDVEIQEVIETMESDECSPQTVAHIEDKVNQKEEESDKTDDNNDEAVRLEISEDKSEEMVIHISNANSNESKDSDEINVETLDDEKEAIEDNTGPIDSVNETIVRNTIKSNDEDKGSGDNTIGKAGSETVELKDETIDKMVENSKDLNSGDGGDVFAYSELLTNSENNGTTVQTGDNIPKPKEQTFKKVIPHKSVAINDSESEEESSEEESSDEEEEDVQSNDGVLVIDLNSKTPMNDDILIDDSNDGSPLLSEKSDTCSEISEECPKVDNQEKNQELSSIEIRKSNDISCGETLEDKNEEFVATEKAEEIAPTCVVQSESVQHPFVSSSVEDFMPNSPSILSSHRSSPLMLTKSDQNKSKAFVDVQSTEQTFLPELSASEDEVISHPTTTTKTKKSSHSVQTIEDTNNANKSSTIDSLKTREVPQNPHHSDDNKSNLTKKTSKSGEKRKSKLSSKPPKKMKISESEEREYLHLIKSRPTGWDKGWSAEEIVGINSLNSTLVFLVKWTNKEQTIVLSDVAKFKCPQLVIKFYEKHSVWDD